MTTMFEDDDVYDPDPERFEFIDKCFEDVDNFLEDDNSPPYHVPEDIFEDAEWTQSEQSTSEPQVFNGFKWGDDVIDADWCYIEDENEDE